MGLGSQELSSRGAVAARGGVDAGSLQDQPHGAGRKRVAEASEFALNSSVPPEGRVVSCQPCKPRIDQDQPL